MDTLKQKREELEAVVYTAEVDVRNHRQALMQAEHRREMARARLDGFLVAVDLQAAPVEAAKVVPKPISDRTRRRKLTGHWQKIMQTVYGAEFGYDDLLIAADLIDHSVTKETLRSQMSGYKQAGIVRSTGDGKFLITDYGMEAAGIDQPTASHNANGAAEAAPDTGEVAASPDRPELDLKAFSG